MKSGTWQMPVFLLGLTMGTASTLMIKAVYQTQGIGSNGLPKFYEKPIVMTFFMFLGMAAALPLYYAIVYYRRRSTRASRARSSSASAAVSAALSDSGSRSYDPADPFGDASSDASGAGGVSGYQTSGDRKASALLSSSPLLPSAATDIESGVAADDADEDEGDPLDDPRALLDPRLNFLLLIPSLFDLVGTALSTIGLLYTSVSVYQLSRCTVIIVTAVLKACVLGHHLSANMWAGVATNAAAMLLVGATAILAPEAAAEAPAATDAVVGTAGDARLGIIFILASCLVQGAQYVFEEKVLSFDAVPPLILVGMEGVWGVILFLVAVFPLMHWLPGADNGMYEDCWEGFTMLGTSGSLFALVALFTLIVFLYNVFCIYITFLLNSVWHAIMDNCRPVAVWAIGTALYYSIGSIGEPWSAASWFQLAGMVLLFYGTAVYNGNLTFPGIKRRGGAGYDPVPGPDGEYAPEEEGSPLFSTGVRDALPATPMFVHAHAHAQHGLSGHLTPGAGASISDVLTRSPMVLAKRASLAPPEIGSGGGIGGGVGAGERKPHFLAADGGYAH